MVDAWTKKQGTLRTGARNYIAIYNLNFTPRPHADDLCRRRSTSSGDMGVLSAVIRCILVRI